MRPIQNPSRRPGLALIVAAAVNAFLAALGVLGLPFLIAFVLDSLWQSGSFVAPSAGRIASIGMWTAAIATGLFLSVGYWRVVFRNVLGARWFWVLSGVYNAAALIAWPVFLSFRTSPFAIAVVAWCGFMTFVSVREVYRGRTVEPDAPDRTPA